MSIFFETYPSIGAKGKDGQGGIGGKAIVSKKKFHVTLQEWLTGVAFGGAGTPHTSLEINRVTTLETKPAGLNGTEVVGTPAASEVVPNNQIQQIVAYKNYMREYYVGHVIASELKVFLENFDRDSRIQSLYVPLSFVNEFLGLENQFLRLRNNVSFIPFLESLHQRIVKFEKARKPSGEDKKLIDYLFSAIFSQICVINRNANQNVIIDLPEYLKLLKEEIENLLQTDNQVAINNNKNKYKQLFDTKIDSAKNIIETEILPEIDRIFDEIDKQIYNLLSENAKKQEDQKSAIEAKIEERRELRSKLAFRAFMLPIRIMASLLPLAGPVGAVAGTMTDGMASLANSLYLDDTAGSAGSSLVSTSKKSIEKIGEEYKKRGELLKAQLNEIDVITNKHLEEMPDNKYVKELDAKIKETKNKLKDQKSSGSGLLAQSYRKDLEEFLADKKKILKQKEPKTTKDLAKTKQFIETVGHIVSIAEISVDQFNRIKNDKQKLEDLADTIKAMEKDLEVLKKHEEMVHVQMVCSVSGLKNTITSLKSNGKSILEMDLSNWKIQSALRDMKLLFHKMSEGFTVTADLLLPIEKLELGMTFMADIYDRIDSYSDKQMFADYVANIAFGVPTFQNADMNTAVTELQQIIKSNLLLERFEVAIHAFKQHYFPFAHLYMEKYHMPSDIELKNATSIKGKAIAIIGDLEKESRYARSAIGDYEKYKMISDDETFYTWDNHVMKNETIKLLQGQEIVLNADIANGLNYDAIKFKKIGIRFVFTNQSLQNEFDAELENFSLIMTMVGNNYYRCGSRFYYISGNDNIAIDYSFKNNSNGLPKIRNSVYEGISQNDFFLSPYTIWKVKLSNNKSDFEKLQKFLNTAFEMQLTGIGQYLKEFPIDFCNKYVNKYYTIDRTITIE